MPQRTDLYTILYSYARKTRSPEVSMETFISFLERYAKRVCGNKPEWIRWTEDTAAKVWADVNQLAEEDKLEVRNGAGESRVYVTRYYAEQVKEAYDNAEQRADVPFPDETYLKITLPKDQLRTVSVTGGLPAFLDEPQEAVLPVIKLKFPNDAEALILAPMIPLTLLEFALSKVKHYLLRQGNKDYVQHKMTQYFGGKEEYLRDMLERIMNRPGDCVGDIKDGRESSFYFWTYFGNLLKSDLNQKGELLADETGAVQAVYVLGVCSSYYKTAVERSRVRETAFKNFELELEKLPYYFSREAIARFKDSKGIPLLDQYGEEALDAYVKKRIAAPAVPNELPELLFITPPNSSPLLMKKAKVLPLCARLFTETRPLVLEALSRRWKKLVKDYLREPAMEDDGEFDKLIASYVAEFSPLLHTLLRDPRLCLIHEEVHASRGTIPDASRLFNKRDLLPLHSLLALKRREIISDIRLLMPFWYSVPLFYGLAAFFSGLGKKKPQPASAAEKPPESPRQGKTPGEDRSKELQESARKLQEKMIPKERSPDSYLQELSGRWNRLMNKRDRDNLVEDINSLLRDRLRRLLRLQKKSSISEDSLTEMAVSIINSSDGLRKIQEQKALTLYAKVYLLKLIAGGNVRA